MEDWNRNDHQGRTKQQIEDAWRINILLIKVLLVTLGILILVA